MRRRGLGIRDDCSACNFGPDFGNQYDARTCHIGTSNDNDGTSNDDHCGSRRRSARAGRRALGDGP